MLTTKEMHQQMPNLEKKKKGTLEEKDSRPDRNQTHVQTETRAVLGN